MTRKSWAILCIVILFPFSVFAQTNEADQAVYEETLQSNIKDWFNSGANLRKKIKEEKERKSEHCKNFRCTNVNENLIAALTDLLNENPKKNAGKIMLALYEYHAVAALPLEDDLQIYLVWSEALKAHSKIYGEKSSAYYIKKDKIWSADLIRDLEFVFATGSLTDKIKWLVLGETLKSDKRWKQLQRAFQNEFKDDFKVFEDRIGHSALSSASELVHGASKKNDYDKGAFKASPQLFLFCRKNREYPCLFVMKNSKDELHKNADGKVWTQEALALSSRRLKFNQTNGQTPQGVYRIDGVMPSADQKLVFGKYRRMIINFVGKSTDEANMKLLLPDVLQPETWWNESVVARDVGRGNFRVHGTGRRSTAGTTYFPHVPTAGCISQRENKYGKISYIDQRLILNEVMKAQGLEVKDANEPKIKALLYVYNMDEKKEPVSVEDLQVAGVIK